MSFLSVNMISAKLKHSLVNLLNVVLFACILLKIPTTGLSSQNISYEISDEERVWLTQFFTDIMLTEHGIYTLCGSSKPITLIVVDTYSEKEIKAFFNALTEEEKKEYFEIEGYSLPETWQKWEEISRRFSMPRFRLFKTDLFQSPDAFFVLFVDILKTALIIQENYGLFQKAVKFDFHPLEVALEIDKSDSKFWKNIEGHSNLFGLLFGYGKTNSTIFHWKHPKACEEFCQKIPSSSSREQIKGKVKFSIDHFDIPSFISFGEYDEVVEKYKEERSRIKQMYQGHDFLDLTLKKLTH